MSIDTVRCVVLNSTYEPISIITSRRALVLILEGKAIIVEEHPQLVVRSPSVTFKLPVVVALKVYVQARKIFKTPGVLTQRNLFLRDNHTCQYCNRHRSKLSSREFLTRDHIIPECRGGNNDWTNVVTACSTCNNKKANHYLHEVNFTLHKKPTIPTLFELWMKTSKRKLHLVS